MNLFFPNSHPLDYLVIDLSSWERYSSYHLITCTTRYTCQSHKNPIEKSSISHSYVSVSSSKDVSIGHDGDFHWVSCDVLVLRLSAECIHADCSGSYVGLHVSQLPVPCASDESVLLPSRALWWHYPGWRPSTFPSLEVPYWWWVWHRHPANTNCFCGVRSLTVILPDYFVGSYHLEPSQPSVIHLSLDSSTSSASPAPTPIHSHGFIRIHAVSCGQGRA